MSGPTNFPPVRYDSDRAPWEDPNYIGQGPMRAPSKSSLPLPGNVPSRAGGPAPGQSTYIQDPHHYANVVSAAVNAAVLGAEAASQPFAIAANTKRNLLMFRNASVAAILYIEFGKVPTVNTVLAINPGQIILLDVAVPQDDIYVAGDVAGGVLAYGLSTINV